MMKKILIVFGTRPEAIKMAPVIIELKKNSGHLKTFVCVTGQHREMLDQVLKTFDILPDFDLDIMKSGQDLEYITKEILTGISEVLREIMPDIVLVQGDTTTTFTAALAAFYLRIPVAHVEAGLRSHNMNDPWPEECNRMLTSRLATWHFAPTQQAKQNLVKENINENHILVTGNTVVDSLKWVLEKIDKSRKFEKELKESLLVKGYDIHRLKQNHNLVMVTSHRRENIGHGIREICNAIKDLSLIYPDIDFVFPVHLNPGIRSAVFEILNENIQNANVFLLKTLDYPEFICLMKYSYIILTDSGGIQEEAPYLGKPVLLLRDNTERPEALESKSIMIVGHNRQQIKERMADLINNENLYGEMSVQSNPFGDGNASHKIVTFLKSMNLQRQTILGKQ